MFMLTVIHGCMFAGKTEELLRYLKRLRYANKTFVLYKPSIDNRYSENMVMTHEGEALPAIVVSSSSEIKPNGKVDVIGIDEVQFFDLGLIDLVERLQYTCDVVCAGLSTDYHGKPFEVTTHLMAIADELVHVKAVCVKCGKPATRSYLLSGNNVGRILIGGSEKYCALCSDCFRTARGQDKENRNCMFM